MGLRAGAGDEAGDAARRARRNRGAGRPAGVAGLLAGLLAGFLAGLPGPTQAARLVAAKGSQPGGYGRIVLTFDAPVAVKPRLAGTVLALGFGEAVAAGPEGIAQGMPDFVGAVRRDPDGTALRLALTRAFRVNVQEAGEQVFVDLLPETWSGLPPPLPSETVAALARRAREAEAALRVRNPAPVPTALVLDLAHGAGRTRLSLKVPPEAQPAFDEWEGATRLSLPGAFRIEDQPARGRLGAEFGRFRIENDAGGARLVAAAAPGVAIEAGRDGENVVIDFIAKAPATAPVIKESKDGAADSAAPADAHPAQGGDGPANPAPGKAKPASGAGGEPGKGLPAAVSASEPRAVEARRKAGSGLVFPFAKPVPAALFEHSGIVTLVFETGEPIAAPAPGDTGLAALGPPRRVGGVTVLRFPAPEGRLVDLVPVSEPQGWELVAGERLAPSESLLARRIAGGGGRFAVSVGLPDSGSAVWLDLEGERIAVVTAGGTGPGDIRRAGVSKQQTFVDFTLLPSRLGLAVLAVADDLAVRPDLDGVAIEREGGVTVSGLARSTEPPVGEAGDLAIDRAAWEAARRGDTGTMLREAYGAAAASSRGERGAARLALTQALMANGLDAEALGALAAAAAEDPVIDGEARTALLRGILAARMGRFEEADRLLATEPLARNPEARLWRGLAAAGLGRWTLADAGLHAGAGVIERYPEEVAAPLHAAAAEAAAELGDWDGARRALKVAARGADALVRDRLALLRARLDEAGGNTAAALDAYEALAGKAERPVAAAAALRWALLGQSSRKLALPEAIERLETLVLIWHGGVTEGETLAALARFYVEAGRWRQVFAATRRANALAPDAPATRTLHETAQSLFEDLFLGERAKGIGGVEALALYFDFKDFAPAGRRADEIVRRLADRLVELDLLDSADELLQHQVEHRLTGPARASVAARLAAIRLMEARPLDALKTLDDTHLPALPDALRSARALLRARALSDLTRTDLALETIEAERGAEVERLRADILWAARRWREAGEAHEALLGAAWRARKPLDEAARADVIRAGIAYGLSGEALGLERLKAKFSGAMAESPDARTFALLTRADAARTAAFREAARRATSAETLGAFLAEYRKRYPESAVPVRGADGSAPRAEAGAAPPG